jgi:pilus retraction protein PilT
MPTYIDELVQTACGHAASDLFLSEDRVPRIKIGGYIHPCGDRVLTRAEMIAFWKICGVNSDTETDRDVAYVAPGDTRFRVNCYRHSGLLGAVLRLIKTSIPALASLGAPTEVLKGWLERTNGLLLVTGPTGAGKSTTLAACLDYLNDHKDYHVVCIEDPMEYQFINRKALFTQREVGKDTPNFSTGLRSALRQAPDVIFLGEIRDAETALIALQAAETGHLVFGTLHSATVTDSLERFVHLMNEEQREGAQTLLSYQLIGVLSQQLLPATEEGSSVLVCEHLEVTAAARDWIREMKLPEIREFMRRKDAGNRVFIDALAEAYQQGRISYETAMSHSGNTYELTRLLRGISH